jgi:hypothetical protein
MQQEVKISPPEWMNEGNEPSVDHLANIWAKKYIQNLKSENDVISLGKGIKQVGDKLHSVLRTSSIQAWSYTEKLIAKEMQRHDVDPQLIDPWHISQDSFVIFNKAIELYSQQSPPGQLSRELGSYIGTIRTHYTSVDPRVIGFVSLQFHYTGQLLLNQVPQWEKERLNSYFKVIDDHLYMPLQRAYKAAAAYDYESKELQLVRHLLPMSTEISIKICNRIIQLYPNYATYSGLLSNPIVKTASIRDTEMFQVYLWVCMLEKSIDSIQQELFPICLMLYPTLNVNWELVWQMINLLGNEIRDRLGEDERKVFVPYFRVLWEMFSPEVFPEPIN